MARCEGQKLKSTPKSTDSKPTDVCHSLSTVCSQGQKLKPTPKSTDSKPTDARRNLFRLQLGTASFFTTYTNSIHIMNTQNNISHSNSETTQPVDGRVNRPNVAKANANTFALDLLPLLQALYKENIVSPSAISDHLNKLGVPTARGGKWAVTTVTNLISRLAVLNAFTEVSA